MKACALRYVVFHTRKYSTAGGKCLGYFGRMNGKFQNLRCYVRTTDDQDMQ